MTKTWIILGCCLFAIATMYVETDYLHGLSTRNNNITFSPLSSTGSTNNIAIATNRTTTTTPVLTAVAAPATPTTTTISSSVVDRVGSSTKRKNKKQKNKKKNKKFLLIHIGPSKTGTTTIQKDSGEDRGYRHALQQDQTLYVGKFHSKQDPRIQAWRSALDCMKTHIFGAKGNYSYAVNEKGDTIIVPILHRSVHDTKKKKKKKQLFIDHCWQQQGTTTNPNDTLMMNGTTTLQEMNIVISDEGYSYKLEKLREKIQMYHTIFVDYLHYEEVIIVGTYRRYYDWLPSTWKEHMKNFCFGFDIPRHTEYPHPPKKMCTSLWDYMWKRHIQRANQYNTGHYQNIHRTLPIAREIVLSTTTTPTITTTDTTNNANANANANNNNNNNKVEILNYFQLPNEEYYNSITTELYCRVLGRERTPQTCQYSRHKGVTAEVHHQGSVENVPYKLILKEAHKRGWVSGYPTTSNNYQAMRYANSTIQTWKDLQDYHTQLLLRTTRTQTQTQNSSSSVVDDESTTTTTTTNVKKKGRLLFPLLCPTKRQLATFLHKSLQFEKLVMPHFFHTPLGEQAHRQAFWHVTANGTISTDNLFCSIDIPTFFGTVTSWEQLIEERMSIESW